MSQRRKITSKQVRAKLGDCSDMTIWRYLRDANLDFPKPIYIRARRFWDEAEIDAWLEARKGKAA